MTPAEPPGARYVLSVGPADVGGRVVVRHALREGGHSDLLGELVAWSGGVVRLVDRHGTEHEVAEDDVVAAKRIPPPPARR